MTASPRSCEQCGRTLERDGGGLCTACMLQLGLEDATTLAPTHPGADAPAAAETAGAPATIGPYVIERLLGEGGMGRVFLAHQEAPIRRTVAIKLIKSNLDSEETLKRFESERRSLELMNHDSIARVLDAGTTLDGRPYFVMEYVDGVPITAYCDEHQLPARERIELLVRVCDAVQHAHVKGVIHRDLKPSNVLVTPTGSGPVPKVIDFGIAKATGERMLEWSHYTEMGRLIGTPEYMSPEQADTSRRDVDTRTDVYSLGVLLYELLVGRTPHDARSVREAGLEEMLRLIRETELPAPSSRLSTLGDDAGAVAEVRATDPGRLARLVRGELDWITMRALEKDRDRRYGSSRELAEDLERFLAGLPVFARPPSRLYLAKKFVRRHRVGVGVAAAGLAALVAFSALMAWQAEVVARERDRARLEAETSERVTGLLVDLFRSSDPFSEQGPDITARTLLDRGIERAEGALAGEPPVLGRVLGAMGRAYQGLGDLRTAAATLERALEIRSAEFGASSAEVADAMVDLAEIRYDQSNFDDAERLYRRAIEIRTDTLGPRHPQTLESRVRMAVTWIDAANYDDARDELTELSAVFADEAGEDAPQTIEARALLAIALSHSGNADAAGPLIDAVVERARLPPDRYDARAVRTMSRLAWVCVVLRRYDQAEDLIDRVIAHTATFFGPDHPRTLIFDRTLIMIYAQKKDWSATLAKSESFVERMNAALGEDHPEALFARVMRGAQLVDAGRVAESEATLREVLDDYDRVGLRNFGWLRGKTILANAIRRSGRFAEALDAHREIQEPCEETLGPAHTICRANVLGMAECLRGLGREQEAEEMEARAEALGGARGINPGEDRDD